METKSKKIEQLEEVIQELNQKLKSKNMEMPLDEVSQAYFEFWDDSSYSHK